MQSGRGDYYQASSEEEGEHLEQTTSDCKFIHKNLAPVHASHRWFDMEFETFKFYIFNIDILIG